MPTAVAFGICVLYFAGVLVGAPVFGAMMTPWYLTAWSAAFVWGYLRVARGRRSTALSVVTVVTILLPVLSLMALVWPLHRSPSAVFISLWSEVRGRDPLGGLELFAPLVAASIIVVFIGQVRSGVKPV